MLHSCHYFSRLTAFTLFLHSLTLISNCLGLIFRTWGGQGDKSLFSISKKWGTQRGFCTQEDPSGSCLGLFLFSVYLFIWFTLCSMWDPSSPVQFSLIAQSCLTLCHPVDCSTPGFPVHHQLVTQPGIKSTPPALRVWSPNHWTPREVPCLVFWFFCFPCLVLIPTFL